MSVIRNIPIARKFTLAFGMVCTLCVGLGMYTYFTLRGIDARMTDLRNGALPSVVHLIKMQGALNTLRIQDLDLICEPGPRMDRGPFGAPAKGDQRVPCRRGTL